MTKIKAMQLIREKCGPEAKEIINRMAGLPDCCAEGCEEPATFSGYLDGGVYCGTHSFQLRSHFAVSKFPFAGSEHVYPPRKVL